MADVNQPRLGRIRHTDQMHGVLILISTLPSMHVESSDVGQRRSYFILFCVGCHCCDTAPAPAAKGSYLNHQRYCSRSRIDVGNDTDSQA